MLQADLKVLGGKFQGKLIPLNTKKFLVGREQDCHLRPNSDMVSRHHCIFLVDDYTVRLRDLGSTNGTRVNGELVRHELVLNDGDKISIGKLELELALRKGAPVGATISSDAGPIDIPPSGFEIPVDAASVETNYSNATSTGIAGVPTMTNMAGDTAIHNAPPAMGSPTGAFPPQAGYGYPAGMPMPGYPAAYPGYPPAGYPPGYPPGAPAPGMYPGYPGAMPGYAMPGAPAAPQAAGQAGGSVASPPVRLPLPQDTGYRDQAAAPPVAPPVPTAEGATPAAAAVSPEKSSNSAADIIKQYMQRRGGK